MTNSVKERIRPELEQAKEESKQRAERISEILKAAASMTFEELKGGSAELNVLTRKSVAELLEELKETPEFEVVDVDSSQLSTEVIEAESTEKTAPTWKELLTNALQIVRDRKGDWFQQLKDYWHDNAAKYDADMTEEYGDRYLKVKSVVKQVMDWFKSANQRAKAATTEADVQPVNIEVMDGDSDGTEATKTTLLQETE